MAFFKWAEPEKLNYTMRHDGYIKVDIEALLQSDRVKKDLAILRQKMEGTPKPQSPSIEEPSASA